jgi:hypothetical protein
MELDVPTELSDPERQAVRRAAEAHDLAPS